MPIGLWIAVLSPVRAADAGQPAPLSLQDCINVALKNQADVIVARNNVTIAKARSTDAKGAYFPQLSLQNNAFRIGSQGVLSQQRTGTALTVMQSVYDGGLREALVRGARYGVLETESGLARTVQTLVFSVTQAYYEVLRSKHLAEVASASVKYNEGLRDMVQTRVELGAAAEVDVLPIEAQLANAQVDLLAAGNSVRTATIQLQNAMGLSPRPGFDVQEIESVPAVNVQPLESYLSIAMESRPDVAQAAAGIGAAKASVRSARISLYPRPAISGQYQAGIAGVHSSSSQMVGGFVFDIFNGGSNRAAYKQAQASRANAEEQSEQVAKDIQAQVQQAYLNLTNAKERLSASEVGLTAAQKNYDVQSTKYKQGLAIPLDLLNAELQVVTAQTNAVQARYDYHIAMAQLEYAIGKQGGLNGN